MANLTVQTMIEGGKATAAPPLGPALGPTGVNIGQVVMEINKKTADMKGMQIPVKVTIDPKTKEFTIEIGTPPSAALLKKEAGVEKGSSNPLTEKVADILIEQIIKVAKMKSSALLGKDTKSRVKEIVGTCQSMGILVEGMPAHEAIIAIDEGKFDKEIKEERTETPAEKKKMLKDHYDKVKAEQDKIAKQEAAAKEAAAAAVATPAPGATPAAGTTPTTSTTAPAKGAAPTSASAAVEKKEAAKPAAKKKK